MKLNDTLEERDLKWSDLITGGSALFVLFKILQKMNKVANSEKDRNEKLQQIKKLNLKKQELEDNLKDKLDQKVGKSGMTLRQLLQKQDIM